MTDANPRPYSWAEAREKINLAKGAQSKAEAHLKEMFADLAEKRRAYQVALAEEIVRLRGQGFAVTAAGDVARGEERVALLRYERDVQDGVVEAAKAALWRLNADRRELEQLVQWSMRADFANDGGGA